jgi:endonuclease/exonuclease/phosphatase family metal-dependent hydrolase
LTTTANHSSAIRLFMTVALGLWASLLFSQAQFRVMNYNLLNFPNGEIEDREDTLQLIIDYVQPDLILVQELKSPFGLSLIASVSCDNLAGTYVASTYVNQQSNPGASNPLQQGIVYNTDVFGLKSEGVVITPYRDVNEFVLYLQDEALADGDTSFLYVYTTHLKSSTGSSNEALRLQMIDAWREHVDANVPADASIIIGGDFNLYSSDEPAYQELLSSDNLHQLFDPIDAPGEWSDTSFPQKDILTQCTRVSQIFNDGASSGLDDRFDFVLVSGGLMGMTSPLHVVENSYHSLGNNGTCYDQNIIDCAMDNEVPYEILRALYYMSDHLPVVVDFEFDLGVSVPQLGENPSPVLFPNPGTGLFSVKGFPENMARLTFQVFGTDGRLVNAGLVGKGEQIDLSSLSPGVYMLKLGTHARWTTTTLIISGDF